MTLPLFEPDIPPSYDIAVDTEPRLLSAAMGDGYVVETGDGLNILEQTAPLAWDAADADETTSIAGFFETNAGKLFRYQIPGDSAEKVWICRRWSVGRRIGNRHRITATFERRYDAS